MSNPISILAVTNMYPSAFRPTEGIFIEEQLEALRGAGVEVDVLHVNRTACGMSVYFRMLKAVAAAVWRTKPSLVHVLYGGVMADRVTRWNEFCPTLVTFHGSDLLGENFSGLWRKWISRYGIRCSHRAARMADGIVVVSRRLQQALPTGLDPMKIRVIPCGIDLGRFQPMNKAQCQEQLGWNACKFNVLFASNNLDPVKRPELASAAVAELNNMRVPAELKFMHGVPREQVPVWMNASDALLLTSAQEGSPTVVKEALACGLPVVSVDAGDVPERIARLECCHIAATDPHDLAAKLALVQRTGRRVDAASRLNDFDAGKIARQLKEFYRDILERCQHGAARRLQPAARADMQPL